jgi:5S rRNA maturation endonuclease (ribonuclease M5)
MDPAERLKQLDRVLEDLRLANKKVPVLVEGPRDVAALRSLGIHGPLRQLHGPGSVLAEADRAARETDALIVLTDWDRTGGSLARRLRENLSGRITLDLEIRRRLARIAHVKCVEDLPAFRRNLAKQAHLP